MKNNAICFFVDSVVWDYIGNAKEEVSPTPFLDSLKKEGLVANNLYSHGPYTDAATRSLFTGRNCLDDYGYYFKLNTAPINHYKLFHDAGYETYDFHYPYYIKGKELNRSIDHRIYTGGFEFASEWGGLYYYYSDIIKQRELNETEIYLLSKRMQYMFESWELYLNDIINNPESLLMHKKAIEGYDAKGALKTLLKEHDDFCLDHVSYINKFLREGKNHTLASLDATSIEAYMSPEFMKNYVEKTYDNLFRTIEKNNIIANWKRNLPTIKRIWFSLLKTIKTKDFSHLLFIVNYGLSLIQMRIMRKRWKQPRWQYGHSARMNYDTALKILKERGNKEKPFYLFFHLGEPHNNIAFFTYDIQDKKIVDEELNVIKDYVDRIGTRFKGNLLYLLSLVYTDYTIKRFCESLKKMGIWDRTSLLFISDHGSSYTFDPIHNRRVNCFDTECYHIPMIIRHPGMNPIEVNTYQYSKDVFPTFADILEIPQSKFFKGASMLKEKDIRKVIITEYMGPGCPDLSSRRIWFSGRDNHFIVAYKVGIYEDFQNGELAEVYNLEKDPLGYYNINDKVDITKIRYLLEAIEKRYNEIKTETNSFLKSLANKKQ